MELWRDPQTVSPQELAIPTDEFYIRTRVSKLLPEPKSWRVRVDGLVEKLRNRTIEEFGIATKPMGLHLMECAGNGPLVHFGMISVASWGGVPLTDFLEGSGAKPYASRVLITGFDQYAAKSMSSVPGASWVFPTGELRAARAFLATEMNEKPLTAVTFVDDTAKATSQMQEYAARTHQNSLPMLARDFQPATIDPAAMPIRVEKWVVEQKIKYRVVGIAWGGAAPVKTLMIRFNPEEDYVPLDNFAQSKNDPWTLWTHAWSPKEPGTYSIRLAAKDPSVRTRRLDSGYYVRSVEISEV